MSPSQTSTTPTSVHPDVEYRRPTVADGIRLWEIASDSQVLDVNSSYSYVLWCHDFAATSIVAEVDGATAGFVTAYRRPEAPQVLMVWQIAVDDAFRGRGIAAHMLHDLFDRCTADGVRSIHTTISPDNVASQRLFASVARRRGLRFEREPLFGGELFTSDRSAADTSHQNEDLYRLEP